MFAARLTALRARGRCALLCDLKRLLKRAGFSPSSPRSPLSAFLFQPWWSLIWLVLIAYTFYFFRDPDRAIPQDPAAIVAPADGVVVEIVEIEEPESRAPNHAADRDFSFRVRCPCQPRAD